MIIEFMMAMVTTQSEWDFFHKARINALKGYLLKHDLAIGQDLATNLNVLQPEELNSVTRI